MNTLVIYYKDTLKKTRKKNKMTFVLAIESIEDCEWCEELDQRVGDIYRYTLLKKDESYDVQYVESIHPIITFRNKFYQSYELIVIILYIQDFTMYLSTNDNSLTEKLESVIVNKYGHYFDVPFFIPINLSSLLTTNKNYEFKKNPFNTFDELSNDIKAFIQNFLDHEN